jgi:hypothetical protein
LPVERHHVDLLAEGSQTDDDMRVRRLIALWKIALKELEPDIFAGIALGTGMAETLTCNFEPAFDVVVKAGE